MVAQGKFVRGQEYLRSAEVAEGSRCQAPPWGWPVAESVAMCDVVTPTGMSDKEIMQPSGKVKKFCHGAFWFLC